MSVDEKYMQRCLELAFSGLGTVAPNPLVGAVLVFQDRIIGEGYHKIFGGPHAEVICLKDAEENLRHLPLDEVRKIFSSATMYVSLEPCSHYGKTPPCADLLIEKGIGKVVIGMADPFEQVNGSGISKLKNAGIDVVTLVMERECSHVNRRFISFHKNKKPYIILKWAESQDGFLSKKGKFRYAVSNALTNRLVHKWRTEEAGIMIGTNTALQDDPALTARHWPGTNPIRIVIDLHGRLGKTLQLFNKEAPTFIFNLKKDEQQGNLIYIKINEQDIILQLLNKLYELQVQSILVEGGRMLLQSFINLNLWDEARIIRNTTLFIEEGTKAPHLLDAIPVNFLKILDDEIRVYEKSRDVK